MKLTRITNKELLFGFRELRAPIGDLIDTGVLHDEGNGWFSVENIHNLPDRVTMKIDTATSKDGKAIIKLISGWKKLR